jgi:hypothetical protein
MLSDRHLKSRHTGDWRARPCSTELRPPSHSYNMRRCSPLARAPKRKLAPRVLGSQPFTWRAGPPRCGVKKRGTGALPATLSFAICATKTSAQLVCARDGCNCPGFLRNCEAVADVTKLGRPQRSGEKEALSARKENRNSGTRFWRTAGRALAREARRRRFDANPNPASCSRRCGVGLARRCAASAGSAPGNGPRPQAAAKALSIARTDLPGAAASPIATTGVPALTKRVMASPVRRRAR